MCRFATQPEEVKKKTEHLESSYSFGWSHGKEVLEGKPDFSKGSYYNNPVYDRPFDDEELIKKCVRPTYVTFPRRSALTTIVIIIIIIIIIAGTLRSATPTSGLRACQSSGMAS